VAENALILARHLLHRNFSFYKITDITVFSDKKTEPQFCIKITVLLWVQGRDLNPRPPGYHFVPVAVVCRKPSPVRLCSLALWATPLSKTIHRIVFDSLTQRATLIGLITRYIKRRTDMVRRNVDEVNNLDIYVPKAQLEKGW